MTVSTQCHRWNGHSPRSPLGIWHSVFVPATSRPIQVLKWKSKASRNKATIKMSNTENVQKVFTYKTCRKICNPGNQLTLKPITESLLVLDYMDNNQYNTKTITYYRLPWFTWCPMKQRGARIPQKGTTEREPAFQAPRRRVRLCYFGKTSPNDLTKACGIYNVEEGFF